MNPNPEPMTSREVAEKIVDVCEGRDEAVVAIESALTTAKESLARAMIEMGRNKIMTYQQITPNDLKAVAKAHGVDIE